MTARCTMSSSLHSLRKLSSSGDESSSISSVGDSLPAGFGGGKGRYNGAWYRHKPVGNDVIASVLLK
eukprot:6029917-Alexandrium_andersonii.AAC.1